MKTKGLFFAVMMFLMTSFAMYSQDENQLVFGKTYSDGNGYCYVFNSDGTGAFKIYEEFELDDDDSIQEAASQALTWTQDGATIKGKRHIVDEDVEFTLTFIGPLTLEDDLGITYKLGKPFEDD